MKTLDRNLIAGLFIAALVSAVGAVAASPWAPSLLHALLAAAIIFVGAIPMIIFLVRRNGLENKFLCCSGLVLGMVYGLPVFFGSLWADRGISLIYYNNEFASTAALFPLPAMCLAFGGIAAFIFAAFIVERKLYGKGLRLRYREPADSGKLQTLIWALFFLNLGYHFVPLVGGIPSIGQLAQLMGPICFAFFLDLALKRRLGRLQLGAFVGLQSAIFFKIIGSTLLMPLLIYGMVGCLVLWNVRGRPPVVLVLSIVVAVFVTYTATYSIRAYNSRAKAELQISTVEKLKMIGSFIIFDLTGTKVGFLSVDSYRMQRASRFNRYALQRMVQRVSHIPHLTIAMEKTPKNLPFWKGKSYLPLVTSFIPRLLWADKPEERVGGAFAQHYWQESPTSQMSMNLPWIPELYLNFGDLGVVLGMAMFGVLLAFLHQVLNGRHASDLETAIATGILLPFLFPDSNFSLMMGNTVSLIIFLWVYFALGSRLFGEAT